MSASVADRADEPGKPRREAAAGSTARRSGAVLVAAGIFLSRTLGLIRTHFLTGALGQSIAADAWIYAFRIPNFLNNLFGEGSLSASFIPVYAGLVRDGEDDEAGRTAGAVAAILALTVSIIVLLGVLFAAPLTTLIASGLTAPGKAATRALTDPAYADPLSGCRPVRDVGVVFGHSQQPPPVLPVVRRASAVEPGDDRRAPRLPPRRGPRAYRGDGGVGVRRRRRRCSFSCSSRASSCS